MIRVTVHMHAHLRRFLPEGAASADLDLPEGTAVTDVMSRFGAQREVWVAAINNEVVQVSARLRDGDCLDLFPPIEGG